SSDAWRKSSFSAGDGGDCLEVADGHATGRAAAARRPPRRTGATAPRPAERG
ncbi:DUF397 domain-containing protein, partial [Streptomyces sp. NPDC005534]|uniref:DUF397 domain-containing protein n=1 Tax=Streptomyces sp. NPDC005534 TaxID=3155714 RepID=UPI00345499B0